MRIEEGGGGGGGMVGAGRCHPRRKQQIFIHFDHVVATTCIAVWLMFTHQS